MPHRKFLAILDTTPELICRYDSDLVLTYVNRAFAEFFGDAPASFEGRSLLDIVQEKQREPLKTVLAQLSHENPTVSISSERQKSDGTHVFLTWNMVAIYDDNLELLEYQSMGRDITQERELKRKLQNRNTALEAMQAEMRIVLDSMPCKVWYKDDKNTILQLNKTAAESMGMTIKEVEGKNTYDLFGDSAKAYHEADLEVIETGTPLMGIVERYTPNEGDTGWVQTDKIPFNHPVTGDSRILVVATDITELKEKEALLKSINKNLDDFASLTSHDLQAPLRHVAIFAELLQVEYGDKLDEDARVYLKEIREGVVNMRGLIKSFLKFMRSSPEGIDLDHVNLTPVIKHIADRHSLELSKIGGSIHVPDEDIYVQGDEVLLNQVIGNLVENSIKYRDEDRPVDIDITAKKQSGEWHISVADNGAGIDKSYAPHVFDLFGRAKPHSQTEGSGVGLALCKRIITLHGGGISLANDRQQGSQFTFTLNAAKPQKKG